MPIVIADARPKLTKGLVLLEPTGPPFRDAVFGTKPARQVGTDGHCAHLLPCDI